MQFTVAAIAALVATASAAYTNGTVVYTTEVFTAYTTVCPAATELTFNGKTYTATTSTTLTITNCPCTVIKPVTTSSVVVAPSSPAAPPVYANTTTPAVPTTPVATKTPVGTTSIKSSPTAVPSTITASGAGKAMTFSGASLAGLVAAAAYLL
jgi:hypothetical protein